MHEDSLCVENLTYDHTVLIPSGSIPVCAVLLDASFSAHITKVSQGGMSM